MLLSDCACVRITPLVHGATWRTAGDTSTSDINVKIHCHLITCCIIQKHPKPIVERAICKLWKMEE